MKQYKEFNTVEEATRFIDAMKASGFSMVFKLHLLKPSWVKYWRETVPEQFDWV
jgi:hypothetical protein